MVRLPKKLHNVIKKKPGLVLPQYCIKPTGDRAFPNVAGSQGRKREMAEIRYILMTTKMLFNVVNI